MSRRDPIREHVSHPQAIGPAGGNAPFHRIRHASFPMRDDARPEDQKSQVRFTQLKISQMSGELQQGEEQRDRFPARYRSSYLPLLRDAVREGDEHPLQRAGRMLEARHGHEPLPGAGAPGDTGDRLLQARLDELSRRLNQMQQNLTSGHTEHKASVPAVDPPTLDGHSLHARLTEYLDEWNLWQNGPGERDLQQELVEFCRSDYLDKLIRLHPLPFLILDAQGSVIQVSPGSEAIEELAGMQPGDRLEDRMEYHAASGTEPGWLQDRRGRARRIPLRDWPLPGGRLLCLLPNG